VPVAKVPVVAKSEKAAGKAHTTPEESLSSAGLDRNARFRKKQIERKKLGTPKKRRGNKFQQS